MVLCLAQRATENIVLCERDEDLYKGVTRVPELTAQEQFLGIRRERHESHLRAIRHQARSKMYFCREHQTHQAVQDTGISPADIETFPSMSYHVVLTKVIVPEKIYESQKLNRALRSRPQINSSKRVCERSANKEGISNILHHDDGVAPGERRRSSANKQRKERRVRNIERCQVRVACHPSCVLKEASLTRKSEISMLSRVAIRPYNVEDAALVITRGCVHTTTQEWLNSVEPHIRSVKVELVEIVSNR